MNIDEAISKAKELIYDEEGNFVSYIDLSNDVFDEITTYEQAIETIINEYNNLKQIEEAHRIENGELRERIKQLEKIDKHITTKFFLPFRLGGTNEIQ